MPLTLTQTVEAVRSGKLSAVEAVQSLRLFLLQGNLDSESLNRIARELLVDPVSEEYCLGRLAAPAGIAPATLI